MLNLKIQSTTGVILLAGILFCAGCTEDPSVDSKGISQNTDNSLIKAWSGLHNGVPSFDQMSLGDLKPALNQAMALNLIEIENIAAQSAAPNFDNTIVALERTGKVLDRVFTYYGIWSSNLSSPEFRDIEQEMAPIMSAFFSKISQNQALFERVKVVYENLDSSKLRADQKRLVKLTYLGFSRNGATLSIIDKKRYTEINQRLAALHTQFGNNVLIDEENYVVFVSESQLGGLPASLVNAAAAAAKELGKPEMYAITNTRSSMAPFLTFSEQRSLRQQVWSNYYSRGDNDDQYDNNEIIAETTSSQASGTQEVVLEDKEEEANSNIFKDNHEEEEKVSNGLENFEIEDDALELFNSENSPETENDTQEFSSFTKEENNNEEDDLEIPAFLRRQKN